MLGIPIRKKAFAVALAITSCLNGLLPTSLQAEIQSMVMITHQICVVSKERPYVIPL